MYESPIEVMYGEIHSKMVKDEEDRIMYEVNRQVGVHVDREQMIRALQYDRNQYEKGYRDALNDVIQRIEKDKIEIKDVWSEGFNAGLVNAEFSVSDMGDKWGKQ